MESNSHKSKDERNPEGGLNYVTFSVDNRVCDPVCEVSHSCPFLLRKTNISSSFLNRVMGGLSQKYLCVTRSRD